MRDIEKFSSFVITTMESVGIDYAELSKRTGLSRVTISRHMNGHRMPHYSSRTLYASAFKMDPDSFERAWRSQSVPAVDEARRVMISGGAVRARRLYEGLSIAAFSEAIGIDEEEVKAIESKERAFVDFATLERLSSVLKTLPENLTHGTGPYSVELDSKLAILVRAELGGKAVSDVANAAIYLFVSLRESVQIEWIDYLEHCRLNNEYRFQRLPVFPRPNWPKSVGRESESDTVVAESLVVAWRALDERSRIDALKEMCADIGLNPVLVETAARRRINPAQGSYAGETPTRIDGERTAAKKNRTHSRKAPKPKTPGEG